MKSDDQQFIYDSILKFKPMIAKILSNHDTDDFVHDVYIKIINKIDLGALSFDCATTPAYLRKICYHAAMDLVRIRPRRSAVVERRYQEAVSCGLLENSQEAWGNFEHGYRKVWPMPPRKEAPLVGDVEDRPDLRLDLLLVQAVADCIGRESPHAILLLKTLRGMTWHEIAAFEYDRRIADAALGQVDPNGYGDSEAKARRFYDAERAYWGSTHMLESLMREYVNEKNIFALLEQLESMYSQLETPL